MIPEKIFVSPTDGTISTVGRVGDVVFRKWPYQMHKFPTSFQAVDNVIIDRKAGRILLGQKKNEKGWRFPGGFMDPADKSLEIGCARERQEECGVNLEVTPPKYAFSFRVPDPRYDTNHEDKIMSAVFVSFRLWGVPKGGDDLPKVKWVTKDYLRRQYKKVMMPCHVPLVEGLLEHGYL
jgi:8-oxo-dGTP pyrophosphatase MutT (NUDIX family)